MATLVMLGRPFQRGFINSFRFLQHTEIKSAGLCKFKSNLGSCSRLFSDRRYSEKHEWILVQDKVGTIGITDYAQNALGDVVYAQLPDVGLEFSKDDECGALESVKAASEVYTPVSGKILEKNSLVEEKPALINTSCYDQGWLFKIELSKPDELSQLMDDPAYEKFLKSQED